jgi:hypothetical protein
VDIPAWLTPARDRSWRLNVVERVVAASAAVIQAGGHLGALDVKLGSGLTKVSPSSSLNAVQARKRAAVREGTRVLG